MARGTPPAGLPPKRCSRPANQVVPLCHTSDAIVRRALTLCRVSREDIVLDVGCGDGRVCTIAAKEFGAEAHGLDICPSLLEAAAARADAAGVKERCHFHQGDFLSCLEAHPAWERCTVVYWFISITHVCVALQPVYQRAAHRLRLVSYSPFNPHFPCAAIVDMDSPNCISPVDTDMNGVLAMFTDMPLYHPGSLALLSCPAAHSSHEAEVTVFSED